MPEKYFVVNNLNIHFLMSGSKPTYIPTHPSYVHTYKVNNSRLKVSIKKYR